MHDGLPNVMEGRAKAEPVFFKNEPQAGFCAAQKSKSDPERPKLPHLTQVANAIAAGWHWTLSPAV